MPLILVVQTGQKDFEDYLQTQSHSGDFSRMDGPTWPKVDNIAGIVTPCRANEISSKYKIKMAANKVSNG